MLCGGCGSESYFDSAASSDNGTKAGLSFNSEKNSTDDSTPDSDDDSGSTSDAADASGTDSGSSENGEDSDSGITQTSDTIYVQVAGAVNSPGVYEIKATGRVFEAIEMAGGLKDNAYDKSLNQAEALTDGEKIYVYTKKEAAELISAGGVSDDTVLNSASGLPGGTGGSEVSDAGKVNINTATKDELMTLSGIGEAKADSIITYREQNGRFSGTEDIKNVSGIGDSTYERLKDNICV